MFQGVSENQGLAQVFFPLSIASLRAAPCSACSRPHVCASYGQVLRKVPIFEQCKQEFVAAITEHLKPRIYAPVRIMDNKNKRIIDSIKAYFGFVRRKIGDAWG